MKFNVERTVRFTNLLAKGSHIRLNDMMDSNNGIYLVIGMTEERLELMNLKSQKALTINATDDLSRYTFDVGTMQFVPNENKSSENKSFKEKISQNKPINLDMEIKGVPIDEFIKMIKDKNMYNAINRAM